MFFKQRENFVHEIIEDNERLKNQNGRLTNQNRQLQNNVVKTIKQRDVARDDAENSKIRATNLAIESAGHKADADGQRTRAEIAEDTVVQVSNERDAEKRENNYKDKGLNDAGSIVTGVETFQPFAIVEHLQDEKSIVQEVNSWVKGQKTIRNDYMNSINGLLSEADTGIQDIYTKAKRIDDYKTRLYLTHVAIRVVAVGIILFLAGFGIKIIIEKSKK